MELIYSMRRKPLRYEPPRFESPNDSESVRPLCTISTANIIAFSSPTELEDVDGDTWGGYVYVCDLDTPWNCHKVASTSNPVSALEWDEAGKQLLVATTVGDVSIYGQKDYLLNEWQCLYTATFTGEHIIKGIFFHNGRRIVPVDKKPDAPITERYQMQRYTPTLKGFGGVPVEGACVITATGLIGVVTRGSEGTTDTASEALRPVRDRLTTAACANKNGKVLVAVLSSEGGRGCVRCYLCSVTCPPLTVCGHPLPAVYIPDTACAISWSLREDSESLLIGGTSLSLWKCTERAYPVHKLLSKGPLQGSTTPGGGQKPGSDSFNTIVWQKAAIWPIDGAVSVASSKGTHIVATPTAVHLCRDTHVLCTRQVITNEAEGDHSPQKITKYSPGGIASPAVCVCEVRMSSLSCVCVCVDSRAQLHVYALTHDLPTPIAIQHSANLLEYCILTGYDYLDLLLSLKPALVEPLYERITESFQRQPAPFQQYYYHTWLKLRIALCRLSPSLQMSSSWLVCAQTCLSTLASLGRADDHDDDDDDKNVEPKAELIPDVLSAQAMRLPLQRAVDIAITAILHLTAHHNTPHGHEIWSEPVAQSSLRRCVLAARAAGRGADLVWRTLARLTQDRHKHDVAEECAAVVSQFSSPRVWEALPRCTVSAPHGKQHPLQLEYGVEPEALRYVPEPPAYAQTEGSTTPGITMDAIRYMYLGGDSRVGRWRECGRCGSRALPAHASRHPAQRALDARYLINCRCGAKWTLCSNI